MYSAVNVTGGEGLRDKELVFRIQSGDSAALDELIGNYYDEVFRFLYRRLGNRADAEDAAQTVFLKFSGSILAYTEKGRLRHYLLRLAVNTANDLFRKNTPFIPLDALENQPSGDMTPEEHSQRVQRADEVKKALLSLPVFQRDVIILRIYHDLPFIDIARVTNQSLPTVKSRYRQGIGKLKTLLKEE